MSSQVRSDICSSLRAALQLISDATEKLHEAELPSTGCDRLSLGRAMFELLGSIDSLCSNASGLRKRSAETTSSEVLSDKIFEDAMMEAQLFEAVGLFETAVDRYSQFLATYPSHMHRVLIRSEICRLHILLSHCMWSFAHALEAR